MSRKVNWEDKEEGLGRFDGRFEVFEAEGPLALGHGISFCCNNSLHPENIY